jgi:prepilin-type N-terminal cleavage/methylation domain-containing protein
MNTARTRRGFTMIELMVVVMIIVILAGIGVYVGRMVLLESEKKATTATMAIALSAIQRYDEKVNTNRFPPSGSNFYLLLENKNAAQIVMSISEEDRLLNDDKLLILDAWGNEMRYNRDGPAGSRQIESSGPDGISDNSDDYNSNN